MKRSSLGLIAMILATGCYEPPYRTQVVGNGQGGVEIHRVAKDPIPPQPAKQVEESAQKAILQQQAEIARLKAVIAERDDEISRLIRTSTTQKTSDHGLQN